MPLTIELLGPDTRSPCLGHALDPRILLTYARSLYGNCPSASLISVSTEHFELGTGLSNSVAAALPRAIQKVKELIKELAKAGE